MVKKQNKIWQFFRPTIFKLVVTLIIFFVFVPLFRIDTGVRCITEPCESTSDVSILIYLFSMIEHAAVFEVFYANIVTGLIISYIISCIVLVFVDFIKEKTKNM